MIHPSTYEKNAIMRPYDLDKQLWGQFLMCV